MRTNTLTIDALDSIGTSSDRIYVQLVQSVDPANNDVRYTYLTAAATNGNVYLDITGIDRIPANTSASPFTVYVDSVTAGEEVNLLLESSLLETGTLGTVGQINVEVVDLPDTSSETNSNYATFFYPTSPDPTLLNSGIFIDPSKTITIASQYEFQHFSGSPAQAPRQALRD